ncbi:MAG: NAD(P)/FAD-dependent oxidoreductase [Solirubrobacterales bacterium]|nr:NAD(P)/FAD-dependent oxidoreductase [Solirubrobacterales bacterium]
MAATTGFGQSRPRVVIVGGGFGGLTVAKALAGANVEVTLIDRINHHLFQPLLYQVATGILSEGQIAPTLRAIFSQQDNVEVRLAEVTGFELDQRVVYAVTPDGSRLMLPYEFLIVAGGSAHTYFGHGEWAKFAPGLKSLTDAQLMRNRILGAFEMGAEAAHEGERERWLTFVVVGAGPTGVELSGQIAELSHRLLSSEYGAVVAEARIVLVDAAPTVLGTFPERLQQIAKRDLERMGVEVRTDAKVTGVDAEGVEFEDQSGRRSRILSGTVLWAAGVEASPLAGMLAQACGAQVDGAGRLHVNPDCTLPGRNEVFAIGDMVALGHLPGMAQPAIQQGRYVSATIRRRLRGHGKARPFRYFDKGALAVIGHRDAVADVFGIQFGGIAATLLWGFVHIAYLVGWGNRLGTVGRWLWALVSRDRRELCITETKQIVPGGQELSPGMGLASADRGEDGARTAGGDPAPRDPQAAPPR